MNRRKIVSSLATFVVFIVALAAFLSVQDTSAYPTLENLNFGGWLLFSLGIIAVLAIPGLFIFGIWRLIVALPGFLARRLDLDPTPPNPPAPAATNLADIDAEWADIEQQIKEESK